MSNYKWRENQCIQVKNNRHGDYNGRTIEIRHRGKKCIECAGKKRLYGEKIY
jgi:hypothetical protein